MKMFGDHADEMMTDSEYIDFLRARVTKIERVLYETRGKKSPDRSRLVKQKELLANELHLMSGRRARRGLAVLANEFVNVARENLPRDQFELYMIIANKRVEAKP